MTDYKFFITYYYKTETNKDFAGVLDDLFISVNSSLPPRQMMETLNTRNIEYILEYGCSLYETNAEIRTAFRISQAKKRRCPFMTSRCNFF